jgi:hypothetical protein
MSFSKRLEGTVEFDTVDRRECVENQFLLEKSKSRDLAPNVVPFYGMKLYALDSWNCMRWTVGREKF